jgi:hypothetical protein
MSGNIVVSRVGIDTQLRLNNTFDQRLDLSLIQEGLTAIGYISYGHYPVLRQDRSRHVSCNRHDKRAFARVLRIV